MTFKEYCRIEAVNWSSLKTIGVSPLHYRHYKATPQEDTDRLLLGRAAHCSVLEPDRFPLDFVVWDGGDRRGKEWAQFKAANADRGILKAKDYQLCLNMRDAVRGHEEAAGLLVGESEVTYQWTDKETGLDCKARLDHVLRDAVVDYKTAADITPRGFQQSAIKYGYYGQMAFYARGWMEAHPEEDPPDAYIIAVESAPPHDVAVYRLDDYALDYGDGLVDEYLETLRHCLDTNTWPGAYEGVQTLALPAWLDRDTTGWEGLA